MSSTADPQADLPSEELVAYLDGELSPEDARRVEQRLAHDEDYRQQLHDLDQAWEALDALPAATVDDHFARTTIEMVSVAAQQDVSQRAAQVAAIRRKTIWRWAASGLAAAIAGFALARSFVPHENDRLLADLPVIRQFDHLSQIEHVDFLRKLPATVPLDQMAPDAAAVEQELAEITAAAAPLIDVRRQWVAGLSPEEKARLASQDRRFSELSENNPQQEQRLRAMEQELSRDPNAHELRKAMVVYNKWLGQRSPGEQEHLRVLPDDERLNMVASLVRREGEEAARNLSAEDAAKLREAIFEIYRRNRRDFWRDNKQRDDDLRVRLEGPDLRRAIVLGWALQQDHRDDKTREQLLKQLSPEAQEYWERVSRRGRRARRDLLWHWISQAMEPPWDAGKLEEFFTSDKLNHDQRAHLLSLPADEMQTQLKRLYLINELGLRDSDDWLPDFHERERLPGGPPGRARPRPPRNDDERP